MEQNIAKCPLCGTLHSTQSIEEAGGMMRCSRCNVLLGHRPYSKWIKSDSGRWQLIDELKS